MHKFRAAWLAATGLGALGLGVLPPTSLGLLTSQTPAPGVGATPTVGQPAFGEPAFVQPGPAERDTSALSHVPQPVLHAGRIADLPTDAKPGPAGKPTPIEKPTPGEATGVEAIAGVMRPSLPGAATKPSPETALAYAPGASPDGAGNPLLAPLPAIEVDITGVREAIAAYRNGDASTGDFFAASTTNPLARATVDFAAARLQPKLDRLTAFFASRPDWPASDSLRRRAEEAFNSDRRPSRQTREYFAARKPETAVGKLALARALFAEGHFETAPENLRQAWREFDLSVTLENAILKEFGALLVAADHKARSDRFHYKENTNASLRAAALGGPDVLALAQARASLNEKLIAALPDAAKKDPTLLFARIQRLRRDHKIKEAGALMLSAPREAAVILQPDEWWVERRLVARKLLDISDAKSAYLVAAGHAAVRNENRIDAEFHAGWIALRYLGDAALAKKHFELCASFAETPISIARAAYWRGRAAEALSNKTEATAHYQIAATHTTAYYGQLARARLGRNDIEIRRPARVARGDERHVSVRVVELLAALEQKDLATQLANDAVRGLNDEAQIAALAEVLTRSGDANATLNIGKLASQRGFALDEAAYPIFGIPPFEPLARSAEKPLVYAIARQESAFAAKALSTANAKGLMQMITSTARVTANKAGVPFDEFRLINDPAFNAQLGAAHLADLLAEYRNSHILTFAAYNAGGRRVREWITAYGDPREPNIDPIDWIERIPIAETRNYVQRIVENLEVYRVRLGERDKLAIEHTLRHAEARR